MREPDGTGRSLAPENTGDFRAYARDWVRQNLTRADPGAQRMVSLETDDELRDLVARHRQIQARLYGAGLAGIRYPREYGGQGLTEDHQRAFIEETAGYEVPVQLSVTLGILGPTLLDFGTEQQKQTHIRGMLRGDEIWVQLLSEPSSGSDMAGVLTRAQRDGDVYMVNGSKIWTTGAHVADYGMLLARTDPELPKHSGLSMIITPLSSPGVTIAPIRLATGASDFCQEFLDDVMLPVANLIGKENGGWAVASRLLFHERNMVGGIGLSDTRTHAAPEEGAEYDMVATARRLGASDDPLARQLIGESVMLERLAPLAAERMSEALRAGILPGPGASLLKLLGAVTSYRQAEIGMQIAGQAAAVWPAGEAGEAGLAWLGARAATVAGGTNEMQLNQISERVLGLPRDLSPDRDLPFSQQRHNAPR